MTAWRRPGQSPSTSVGVLATDCTPNESASRRAGSTVTTPDRRPARPAATSNVAETVVLPTPPEPQHTITVRCSTISGRVVTWRRPPGRTRGLVGRLMAGLGRGLVAGLIPRLMAGLGRGLVAGLIPRRMAGLMAGRARRTT